jgi:hypothetical protein
VHRVCPNDHVRNAIAVLGVEFELRVLLVVVIVAEFHGGERNAAIRGRQAKRDFGASWKVDVVQFTVVTISILPPKSPRSSLDTSDDSLRPRLQPGPVILILRIHSGGWRGHQSVLRSDCRHRQHEHEKNFPVLVRCSI